MASGHKRTCKIASALGPELKFACDYTFPAWAYCGMQPLQTSQQQQAVTLFMIYQMRHWRAAVCLNVLNIVSQVVHGWEVAPVRQPAEAVHSAYDIVWQVGEPMLPGRAPAAPKQAHRINWQSDSAGQHPSSMPIGHMHARSGRHVYPAREALRSVAWLQAAVRGSKPGSSIRLNTRGALSFPQQLEAPGALQLLFNRPCTSCCIACFIPMQCFGHRTCPLYFWSYLNSLSWSREGRR